MDVKAYVAEVTRSARKAASSVARASAQQKNTVLSAMARNLRNAREALKEAN